MSTTNKQPQLIRAFLDSIVTTFQRMRNVGEQLHEDTGISPAMRLIMRVIHEMGPMTVPQIAREKPVSRQVIQKQVKSLIDKGYIEQKANPAHNTSQLLDLTDFGRSELSAMNKRESDIFENIDLVVTEEELMKTIEVIQKVEQHLGSRDWKEFVNQIGAANSQSQNT
ncbi:MarR family protein [Poriferisphaera corsica]|uniref:MarR family protein n=1 Tax=Poriferisphaera corsica TaxID=2528020 RepID=A0A517YX72_9BACT|nr:MarR family winged helix-turn-helix transcriptional regulator [Poriferisphaera corsica]QDU34811.1 MarR family protein [Poriferisphaera corsica]